MLLIFNPGYCQYGGIGHTYISESTVDNPVEVEVIRNGSQYLLYAMNKTYYPFLLEIKMTDIINLVPTQIYNSFEAYPGTNELITFTARDPSQPNSYNLNFSFSIGIPSKDVDFEYPYLMPLKGAFEFQTTEGDSNLIRYNYFKISAGDTIFAMRKGIIAAVPNMFEGNIRISDKESLEIIHRDGTIMIYENLDPDFIFVKPERIVYPGQAIGIIKNNLALAVILVLNKGENKFEVLDFYYYLDENSAEPFSIDLKNVKILHPVELITREMSKKELKKYKNGKLAGLN